MSTENADAQIDANSPVAARMADRSYREYALDSAVNGLRERWPDMSASVPFTRIQKTIGFALLALVALGFVVAPKQTAFVLVTVMTVVYVLSMVDRLVIFGRGLVNGSAVVPDDVARAIDEDDLPSYTVLVPAYNEPEVVGDLIANLEALEYPKDKLQILLLLEADDEVTIAAAEQVSQSDSVTVLLVPEADPRTKPKACNYGLHFATGELVTIYDAEDKPDPLQLRRVAHIFAESGDDVVCVQAKLSFHNPTDNVLTRWFTADYGIWFGYLLPGIMVSRAPIPLGGTSNHFRRSIIADIGGWDPFNVTEDADLGVRIASYGYRTAVVDSTTLEEANLDAINWVRQRSRWYKGYMQSWLVHVRHPRRLIRTIGAVSFYRFTLLLAGTPLIACVNMLFWLMLIIWITGQPGFVPGLFWGPTYYLALISLLFGNVSVIYMNIIAVREDDHSELLGAVLMVPAYWVMMSIAALKGMWQLIRNPSYWEKTFHGLSTDDSDTDSDTDTDTGADTGPKAESAA